MDLYELVDERGNLKDPGVPSDYKGLGIAAISVFRRLSYISYSITSSHAIEDLLNWLNHSNTSA